MRVQFRKGFSLIELLVSLVILGFLLTVSLIIFNEVYSVLSRNFSPVPKKLEKIWKLKESIESTLTYIYLESNNLKEFYKISPNEVYYISNYSALGLHPPVLCHIYKKSDKLILSEIQVYDPNVNFLTLEYDDSTKRRELVLFSNVRSISIKYVKRKVKNRRNVNIPLYIKILIKLKNKKKYSFTFKIKAYDPDKLPLSKILSSTSPI